MRDMDELFDIFFSDDQQRRQLEKQYLIRMTDKDFEFYSDQKRPRLMKCFNIVETLTTSDVKSRKAIGFITPISKRRCWCKYFCPNIRQFRQ